MKVVYGIKTTRPYGDVLIDNTIFSSKEKAAKELEHYAYSKIHDNFSAEYTGDVLPEITIYDEFGDVWCILSVISFFLD